MSLAFSLQISLIVFICFFKILKDNDDFLIFGYSSMSLTIAILNEIVNLLTSNSVNILANFSLSLNLQNIMPWCYVNQTIFFFLLLIISSNSLKTDVVTSCLSIFLVFSSISLFSCISPLTIDSSSCFLISSLFFGAFFVDHHPLPDFSKLKKKWKIK